MEYTVYTLSIKEVYSMKGIPNNVKYVCGMGINDMPGFKSSSHLNERKYSLWKNMLYRCYSEEYHMSHPTYKGCSVCARWLYLSNFINDIKSIPGYDLWLNSSNPHAYALDKDIKIKGNKVYSPSTCVFTTIQNNSIDSINRNYNNIFGKEALDKRARTRGREVIGVDPQGSVHEWYGAAEAGRFFGMSASLIQQTCNGDKPRTKSRGKAKGWSFYWKDEYFQKGI